MYFIITELNNQVTKLWYGWIIHEKPALPRGGGILTNERRVLRVLTNEKPALPRGGGILVTTELQGDLKIIRGEVVEVLAKRCVFFHLKRVVMSYLHPSRHAVPGGSVSDASMLGKLIDLRVAAGGPGVRHPEVTTLSDGH